jgi:predicted PurR-regulated permease PerM
MPTASERPVLRSRGERRVTYALKVVMLVALSAIVLGAILDFIGRISSVAVIVIGAVFFTYVIHPAVRRLNTRLPLIWSILIVYLAIAALAMIGLSTVVPPLYEEAQQLVRSMPGLVHNAQTFLTDPNNPIIARLPVAVREYLASVPPQLVGFAQRYAGDAASRAVSLALSVVGVIATVVVIPVMAVYLQFEAPDLIAAFLRVIPPAGRPEAASILRDLDGVLGGFIRGQLLVGATIGACITISLLILHVKYALLIGVTAGLLDVIPYVGAIVGFVPAVTLAFLNDGWQHALLVAIVFALIFQAEGHFIAPRIVSESVGLSPLTVIVAILIGADLLGLAGMFLAVPIAAALRVLVLHALPNARSPKSAEALAAAVVARDPDLPKAKAAQARARRSS